MARFEVLILSTVILIFVKAERNIIPSPAVCATFPNEEFAIDLTRCQNTCEYYGRTWDCPISYKPKGDCFCKPGYARVAEDGNCVSVKNNAACVAKLPITPASCTGPMEIFSESLELNVCDRNCRTYGCNIENPISVKQYKWSPRCICGENDAETTNQIKDYRRLSNGECVLVTDPRCLAEFQPSPERCASLGQVFKVNAPCQQSCYGKQYCPPPGPTCVCPPNKFAMPFHNYYITNEPALPGSTRPYNYVTNYYTVIVCHSKETCPATVFSTPSGGND